MSDRREIKEKLFDLAEQEALVLSQLRDIFQEKAELELQLSTLKAPKKVQKAKAVKPLKVVKSTNPNEARDIEISRLAVKGADPKAIASQFSLKTKTVLRILDDRGIADVAAEMRGAKSVKQAPKSKMRLVIDSDELLARSQKGETVEQLAKAYKCSIVSIGTRLREAKKAAGIEIKRGRPKLETTPAKPKRDTTIVTPIDRKRRGRPVKATNTEQRHTRVVNSRG